VMVNDPTNKDDHKDNTVMVNNPTKKGNYKRNYSDG